MGCLAGGSDRRDPCVLAITPQRECCDLFLRVEGYHGETQAENEGVGPGWWPSGNGALIGRTKGLMWPGRENPEGLCPVSALMPLYISQEIGSVSSFFTPTS